MAGDRLIGETETMRSVVVIDDQVAFRSAARRSLLGSSRFNVIGEAGSAEEGLELIERVHPDLVVMDVRLPGIDGIEATRQLSSHEDHPDVVLVSTYGVDDLPADLNTCGACGFVAKAQFGPDTLGTVVDNCHPADGARGAATIFTTIA